MDLAACEARGIRVVRVPAYSPRSVAEHAFALAFLLARWVPAPGGRVCARGPALGEPFFSALRGSDCSMHVRVCMPLAALLASAQC